MRMNKQYKNLSEIEEYEDCSKYAIDVDGNLWSLKYKFARIRKPVIVNGYLSCRIRDDYGNPRTVYLHKLVALAFIPHYDSSHKVIHKNKDKLDNRLDNIEWGVRPKDNTREMNFILHQSLIDKMMTVHIAAQKKGIRTGNSFEFVQSMVEDAVDDYIRKYGLHKVM